MRLTSDAEDLPAEIHGHRKLLWDLVSIPSVSGDEGACTERLVEFFEAHDREVWIDAVGNVRAPGNDSLLLTSHVDTVPGDIDVDVAAAEEGANLDSVADLSDDEFPPQALWGRGSVDAKGPLAAMAVAAVRTGASFVGVVREETDSAGARHLVVDREAPGAVVNGEPSGSAAMTLGYRGFLAGTYEVETPSAHTSRPEKNALQIAMGWWDRVEDALVGDAEPSIDDDGPSVFESVTTKPVEMAGGVDEDGLSFGATIDFQIRLPPGEDPEDVQTLVEGLADRGTVDWDHDATVPPWVGDPRSDLGRAFRVAIRQSGGDPAFLRKTGTADSNLYADAWDCPVVTYGPGDSALDHAPNEHLPLVEYDRAVEVLETVANRLTDQ